MTVDIQVGFRHRPGDPVPNPGFYDAGIRVTVDSEIVTQIQNEEKNPTKYYQPNGSSIGTYGMYDFVGGHISIYMLDMISTIQDIERNKKGRFEQYVIQLEPWDFVLVFAYLDENMLRISFQQQYSSSNSKTIPTKSKVGYAVTFKELKDAVVNAAEVVLQFAKEAGDERFAEKLQKRLQPFS
jgi:hypothetical protein